MKFPAYLTLFLLFTFFIGSCTNRKSYDHAVTFNFNSFKEVVQLQGDSLLTEELLNPRRIKVIDSLLLIVNKDVEKSLLVYDIKIIRK